MNLSPERLLVGSDVVVVDDLRALLSRAYELCRGRDGGDDAFGD